MVRTVNHGQQLAIDKSLIVPAPAHDQRVGCRRSTQGLGGMEKQSPNTQVSPSWDVYRQAHKAIWLGTVEATDERDAYREGGK
jgi:hypothetical protein